MINPIPYVIYSKSTSEVLRVGQVPDEAHALLQVQNDDEALIMRSIDLDTQYVRNGRIRLYSEVEKAKFADRPHDFATWDVNHMAWVDRRTPEQIRDWKRGIVLQKLVDLEAQQPRAMREAMINGDTTRLQRIEDEAQSLRDQL